MTKHSGIKVQDCAMGFAWDTYSTDWQRDQVTTGHDWSIHVSKYLQLRLLTAASTNMEMVHMVAAVAEEHAHMIA